MKMTTPKYKDILLDKYTITEDGILTKISNNKKLSKQKKPSLWVNDLKRQSIDFYNIIGYTFFKEYDQKIHTFEYLNGDDTDFSLKNMKLVLKQIETNNDSKKPVHEKYNFQEYGITKEGLVTRYYKNGKIHELPFQKRPSLYCSTLGKRFRVDIDKLLESTFSIHKQSQPVQNKKGASIVKRDTDYNILEEYSSIREAARKNGIKSHQSIIKSIRKNVLCKGFIYEYKGTKNIIKNTVTKTVSGIGVIQKDENGNVVDTFDSITQASKNAVSKKGKKIKISSQSLSKVLDSGKQACGYIWESNGTAEHTVTRPSRNRTKGDYDDPDFKDFSDDQKESNFWKPLKYKNKVIEGSFITKNGEIKGDHDPEIDIEKYVRWSFNIPFLCDNPKWFPTIFNGVEIKNYKISKCGQIYSEHKQKILNLDNNNGYKRISLVITKRKTIRIHRLMAYTFLGLKDAQNLVVDHINGIKFDNRLENLRLITPQENCRHALEVTQSRKCGKSRQVNKYDLQGNLLKTFPSIAQAAENCGVKSNTMGSHLKKNAGTEYHKFVWKFKDEQVEDKKPKCKFKVLEQFPHYEIYEDGTIWSNYTRSNGSLKPRDQDGYKRVELSENGKPTTCLVHRLVAEAFLPNPNNYKFVDHLDNNPSNNHVKNLKWCTQSENMLRAHDNGVKSQESRPVLQYDGCYVREFKSMTKAAKYMNIEKQSLWGACNNGYKTGGYNWEYDNFQDCAEWFPLYFENINLGEKYLISKCGKILSMYAGGYVTIAKDGRAKIRNNGIINEHVDDYLKWSFSENKTRSGKKY